MSATRTNFSWRKRQRRVRDDRAAVSRRVRARASTPETKAAKAHVSTVGECYVGMESDGELLTRQMSHTQDSIGQFAEITSASNLGRDPSVEPWTVFGGRAACPKYAHGSAHHHSRHVWASCGRVYGSVKGVL